MQNTSPVPPQLIDLHTHTGAFEAGDFFDIATSLH
jgi:hypothetical protein